MARDRVFVSYRRSDTRPSTNAVRQTLERGLGRDAVFVDVTGIPFGAPFPDHLRSALDRAAVIVAVIGPGWLDARDAAGRRRLDDPDDWVRCELSYGLSTAAVTVIPVLVDDAPWPAVTELPLPLQPFTVLNAATVSHDRWDNDWEPLLDRIAGLLGRRRAGQLAPPPRAAPEPGWRSGDVHLAEGATVAGHVVTNPNVGGDLNLG